jgi:5'-nucleotidase
MTDRFMDRPWTRCAVALLFAATASPVSALDVAISNDDGWSAPGIQALRVAFERAGHRVTLAAPADDQSGSSAGINAGELRITRQGPNEFSVQACAERACTTLVGGEPATSGLIAIDIATRRNGRKPDLLLSGINRGANTGGAAQISGTVGAAIAAVARPLGANVPAIAVSTDPPPACKDDEGCIRAHYTQVAAFTVRLVAALEHRAKNATLLPPGLALNVNYPVTPKGVRWSPQGRALATSGHLTVLQIGCETCAGLAIGGTAPGAMHMVADEAPDRPGTDAVNYLAGYVTIVPMRADYTADDAESLRAPLEAVPIAPAPAAAD